MSSRTKERRCDFFSELPIHLPFFQKSSNLVKHPVFPDWKKNYPPLPLLTPVVLTYGSPAAPGPHVEGTRGPHERDPIGGVVGVERRVLEEGLDELWQLKLLVIVRQWLRPLKVQQLNYGSFTLPNTETYTSVYRNNTNLYWSRSSHF